MKDLEWFLDERGFLIKTNGFVRYHNDKNENIFEAIRDWKKENNLDCSYSFCKHNIISDNIVFISISYIWSDILFSKPLIAIKD